MAIAFAVLATAFPARDLLASTPRLPDLGMARLRAFRVETVGGQTRLRFTTIIINIGEGPFRVYGHDKQNGELKVDQRIKNTDGTWSSLPTVYRMYFAGDGHSHWHVRDLERYVLKNTAGTTKGTGEKHGFCFFDNYKFDLSLPGAPSSPAYSASGCGKQTSTAVTTGLSIGWGDRYSSSLPDQYIDITGLPSGEYTLKATADALGDFREACEWNNSTTARLRITSSGVQVLQQGNDSRPCN